MREGLLFLTEDGRPPNVAYPSLYSNKAQLAETPGSFAFRGQRKYFVWLAHIFPLCQKDFISIARSFHLCVWISNSDLL